MYNKDKGEKEKNMSKYIEIETIGEILKEEFIDAFDINQNILAKDIDVPAGRISEIINNKRDISPDTDLRLTRYFGLSEGYFLRLQDNIKLTLKKREISADINKIIPISVKMNRGILEA